MAPRNSRFPFPEFAGAQYSLAQSSFRGTLRNPFLTVTGLGTALQTLMVHRFRRRS